MCDSLEAQLKALGVDKLVAKTKKVAKVRKRPGSRASNDVPASEPAIETTTPAPEPQVPETAPVIQSEGEPIQQDTVLYFGRVGYTIPPLARAHTEVDNGIPGRLYVELGSATLEIFGAMEVLNTYDSTKELKVQGMLLICLKADNPRRISSIELRVDIDDEPAGRTFAFVHASEHLRWKKSGKRGMSKLICNGALQILVNEPFAEPLKLAA